MWELRAPALSDDALPFAFYAVLEQGTWEAGLVELVRRTEWAQVPIEADVSRTRRRPTDGGKDMACANTDKVFRPSITLAAPPSATRVEPIEHLWSNREQVVVGDRSERLTYTIRPPKGATRRAVHAALDAAMDATPELLQATPEGQTAYHPPEYEVWMERYIEWWRWAHAERAAGRQPKPTHFAKKRVLQEGRSPWQGDETSIMRALRTARQWLERVPIAPPAPDALPRDVRGRRP
jgi:hypothetical protein